MGIRATLIKIVAVDSTVFLNFAKSVIVVVTPIPTPENLVPAILTVMMEILAFVFKIILNALT